MKKVKWAISIKKEDNLYLIGSTYETDLDKQNQVMVLTKEELSVLRDKIDKILNK